MSILISITSGKEGRSVLPQLAIRFYGRTKPTHGAQKIYAGTERRKINIHFLKAHLDSLAPG